MAQLGKQNEQLMLTYTRFILPLLGEYSDSGYREPKDRMIYALRSNGRYQLMVLGTSVLGAVYLFWESGFDAKSFKAIAMALAYAWGLVLAIYLMGHGLVALPRQLIRDSSISGRLKRLQARAPKVHDKLEESIEELGQIEAQVLQLRQRKLGLGADMQDWIEELAETSTTQDVPVGGRAVGGGVPAVVTERFLADLARKLKRARHKKARFVNEWQNLVQQATDLQKVLDSSPSKRLDFGRRSTGLFARISVLTPGTRHHVYYHVLPYLRLALGSFLALASVVLIWSEMIHQIAPKLSLVGLTVVRKSSSSRGQIGFGDQLIASAWLLYMCATALYSVSEVKVWGNRALVKRQTYAESACWYSLQVAKLTVPLSYNFITMMPPLYKDTAFYNFLGKLINLTPLGSGFSGFFPIFILVPACAALFNLYGKVKKVIGFGVLEDESEENESGFGTGGWREGRALIERDLQNDQSNLGLANTSGIEGTSTLPSRPNAQNRAPLLPLNDSRDTATTTARPRAAEEREEDNSGRYFFQDLGERVRNTLDTSDAPNWMRDIGGNFKKPKWMGNDQDGDNNDRNALSRWFGGRSTDGRVRL